MKWTETQLQAITSRGKNLLVSAAAGSGKTAVLTERVIRLVCGGTSLEKMLLITFTNAAAAEMKDRIYAGLSERLRNKDYGQTSAPYIRHQMSIINECNICTFDKFAMKILREYYHVISADPGLKVCDDARQKILRADAMERLLEKHYAKKDGKFIAFMDRYTDSKSDSRAANIIFDLYDCLQSLPDPFGWVEENIRSSKRYEVYVQFAAELIRQRLEYAIDYKEAAVSAMQDVPVLAAKLCGDIDYLNDIVQKIDCKDFDDAFALMRGYKRNVLRAGKAEADAWKSIKDDVDELRELAKKHETYSSMLASAMQYDNLKAQDEYASPFLNELLDLTEEFSRIYSKMKMDAGVMDFSDVEHFALQILENDQVCGEYRDRIEYIFTDEYQDSNMVQESLIMRICRPDNVFMVGDIKQSIYRFRLAEPQIFADKYEQYKGGRLAGSDVIDLNSNFRSKRSVIEFINRIFEQLMHKKNAGIEYDKDAMLIEGNPYTGSCQYEPKLYVVDNSDDTAADAGADEKEAEPSDDASSDRLEALAAVKIIRDYVGKPFFDGKTERPLRYGDMVILMYSVRGAGEEFCRALGDAGIPVHIDMNEGYFDASEIQIMLNLLKLIDNRNSDIPLISILHFPSFGFDEEMLSEIRIFANGIEKYKKCSFAKAFELYAHSGRDESLKEKCIAFDRMIEKWRSDNRYMPLADFLWDVMVQSGILDYMSAQGDGAQRQANLYALLDRAAEYESENSGGLYSFINYIDAVKGKINVGEVQLLSEDADVVRIMTIHKSKGLEFPFVLLAGMNKKMFVSARDSSDVVFHKDMGVGLTLVEPDKYLKNKPASYMLIKEKKDLDDIAEKIRLIYVAMTRARDVLVLSAAVRNADKKLNKLSYKTADDSCDASVYLDLIYPALKKSDVEIIRRRELADKNYADEARDDLFLARLRDGFDVDEQTLPVRMDELTDRVGFEIPVQFGDSKRKYSVSELAAKERNAEPAAFSARMSVPSFASESVKLNAAERGTAYHTVMEHIPFNEQNKSPEDVTLFIGELKRHHILTPAEADAVDPSEISGFFESDIGKRAMRAETIYKEAPFTVTEDYEGRKILVQGTVDCCFVEDGNWVIVDYKSNYIKQDDKAVALSELRDEYVPQLRQYAYALEKITGIRVKEAVLYSFSAAAQISVESGETETA